MIDSQQKILAIGGGKGGVGKSVIAANLAVLLAAAKKRVILIDMDFGSANLHTFLGEKSPQSSIKDFLLRKKSRLSDCALDTQVENLKFISGAGDMPGLANMKYSQKLKIIRHIKTLDSDFIILDLAPGITFNVLDFFSVADETILITTPEATSITNTFSFIKASLFRQLSRSFKDQEKIVYFLSLIKDPNNELKIRTLAEFQAVIDKMDLKQGQKFASILKSFRPKFVLNMVRHQDQVSTAQMLTSLTGEYLNINSDCLGYVEYDDCVVDSVAKMRPFVLEHSRSNPTNSLWGIADKIARVCGCELLRLIESQVDSDDDLSIEPEEESLESDQETAKLENNLKRWEIHKTEQKPKIREQLPWQ